MDNQLNDSDLAFTEERADAGAGQPAETYGHRVARRLQNDAGGQAASRNTGRRTTGRTSSRFASRVQDGTGGVRGWLNGFVRAFTQLQFHNISKYISYIVFGISVLLFIYALMMFIINRGFGMQVDVMFRSGDGFFSSGFWTRIAEAFNGEAWTTYFTGVFSNICLALIALSLIALCVAYIADAGTKMRVFVIIICCIFFIPTIYITLTLMNIAPVPLFAMRILLPDGVSEDVWFKGVTTEAELRAFYMDTGHKIATVGEGGPIGLWYDMLAYGGNALAGYIFMAVVLACFVVLIILLIRSEYKPQFKWLVFSALAFFALTPLALLFVTNFLPLLFSGIALVVIALAIVFGFKLVGILLSPGGGNVATIRDKYTDEVVYHGDARDIPEDLK